MKGIYLSAEEAEATLQVWRSLVVAGALTRKEYAMKDRIEEKFQKANKDRARK